MIGSLDLHSLPNLEKAIRHTLARGCTRIILDCTMLEKADSHAISYITEKDDRFRLYRGGISLLNFTCLSLEEQATRMPSTRFFKDLGVARTAFSASRAGTVIKVDGGMFSAGDIVEVAFSSIGPEKNRAATVRSVDGNKLSLEWEIMDETDYIPDLQTTNVSLTFTAQGECLEAVTRIVSQHETAAPCITMLLPRTARIVDRQNTISIDCRLPVTFRKI